MFGHATTLRRQKISSAPLPWLVLAASGPDNELGWVDFFFFLDFVCAQYALPASFLYARSVCAPFLSFADVLNAFRVSFVCTERRYVYVICVACVRAVCLGMVLCTACTPCVVYLHSMCRLYAV